MSSVSRIVTKSQKFGFPVSDVDGNEGAGTSRPLPALCTRSSGGRRRDTIKALQGRRQTFSGLSLELRQSASLISCLRALSYTQSGHSSEVELLNQILCLSIDLRQSILLNSCLRVVYTQSGNSFDFAE